MPAAYPLVLAARSVARTLGPGSPSARLVLPAAAARRSIGLSPSRQSDALFVHRDTENNNASIPFEFNESNLRKANEIISRYPSQYKKAAVIPLLDLGQRQNANWTSLSVMNYVARLLEMPPMRVYEVATFYTMFNRSPVGKHFVQLCTTTPCMLGGCGSTSILKTLEDKLGVAPGQTTADGKFTLVEVECLGACSNAPMMAINDDFFEDLTPETTIEIIDQLQAGHQPTPGPQSGRKQSENSAGLTTLLAEPYGPGQHCKSEFQ